MYNDQLLANCVCVILFTHTVKNQWLYIVNYFIILYIWPDWGMCLFRGGTYKIYQKNVLRKNAKS